MIFEPIEFALEQLYDYIKNEVIILQKDEVEEIQSLQRELNHTESYLMDMDEVERRATLTNLQKTTVHDLKQILPDIEDCLERIITQKGEELVGSAHEENLPINETTNLVEEILMCCHHLKAFFCLNTNPLIRKHCLIEEIRQITEKLIAILQRQEAYRLPDNINPQVTYRRRIKTTYSFIKDEIIIGLEEDSNTLVAKFVGKDGANTAIVGMGGSGKTTLAKMFYNHRDIKDVFPCRAWVCVSQVWNAHNLLLQICAMLGIKLSEDERSIADVKLQQFLEESRPCLVVLDDVWETEALQELLPILLSGNGRVLITTRNESIVKFPKMYFHIHSIRRLTPKESWQLFSRVVNRGGIVSLKEDGDLEKLGRQMLEKCDGLPLAIVTLAGLLRTQCTIQQWGNIKDHVISRIMGDGNRSQDYDAVEKVLELSYFDLPYYLKPCFLYLGTFKEDEEIEADLLINLWIDEGFLKPKQCPEGIRLEEVAKNVLDELVQRCMVEVVSRDYEGEVSAIRIHDLMRDLCINKAKELGFFQIIYSQPTNSSNQRSQQEQDYVGRAHLRLITHNRARPFVLENSRLRTFICINDHTRYGYPRLMDIEMLKQVRVLNIEQFDLGSSVEAIGNMVLLRYLRLWNCVFTVPKKVHFPKKLRNLQTFIFRGGMKLSDNMFGSMEQLRVLYLEKVYGYESYMLSLGVSKLMSLRSLELWPGQWFVKELPAFSNDLRELKMHEIFYQTVLDDIYKCLNTLTHLETLVLETEGGFVPYFDMQKMELERCQHLKFLLLHGTIKKQGSWLFPPNLLSLELFYTRIEEGILTEVLAPLDHLRELTLDVYSYEGYKLTITGLPKLQKLSIRYLYTLKECRITEGSLPQLRELRITGCSQLERIPYGISNIDTLQLLVITSMPKSFCKRLEKRKEGGSDGGEDFPLVCHIPTVTS